MTKTPKPNAAKLSLAACADRKLVPARKHADRVAQVAAYDALYAHRKEIARRIGAQDRSGMPTAAHRHYALATKLATWAAKGFPAMVLTTDDLTFPKTKLVKGGAVVGTAAVRAVLNKIATAEGIAIPAGMVIGVGADGQDKGHDANVPLAYVVVGLAARRK